MRTRAQNAETDGDAHRAAKTETHTNLRLGVVGDETVALDGDHHIAAPRVGSHAQHAVVPAEQRGARHRRGVFFGAAAHTAFCEEKK